MDGPTRAAIVDSVSAKLLELYVYPDIPADADRALKVAHMTGIENLLKSETSEDGRFRLEWVRRDLMARHSPIALDEEAMQRYVGTYGRRKVSLDGETLYYQRENRPRVELIPLGDDWFRLQGLDYFRIRFITGKDGGIATLVGVYDDGSESPSERAGE